MSWLVCWDVMWKGQSPTELNLDSWDRICWMMVLLCFARIELRALRSVVFTVVVVVFC